MEKIRIDKADIGTASEGARNYAAIGSSPQRVAELMARMYPQVERTEREKIAAVVASAVAFSRETGYPIYRFLEDFELELYPISSTTLWFAVEEDGVLAFAYEAPEGPDRNYFITFDSEGGYPLIS